MKTIPCDIQDNCPEVFMIDQVKCPGEEIELDCGFVVPKGKEDRYFIEWFYEGTSLNKSNKNSSAAERKADPYNVASIKITDPGRYAVKAEYVGTNIPCDKCKPAETEITVKDMDMPIDTVITEMNCVAEPLKPSSADQICFEAVVNGKFYKAKDNVTFAAFSTETSEDTLEVFNTTGDGGKIKFCVSGDKVKDVKDNSTEASKDTIYNVWLEDVSRFQTLLRKGSPGAGAQGGSFQSYGMLMDMYASADLISFDFYAKSYSGASSISATPVVYLAEKNVNGMYVVGAKFWQGTAQTFSIDDAGLNKCTVKCNVKIPGSSARGVRYVLGMNFTGNCTVYEETVPAQKQNSPEFTTPVIDTENFGIYEMGATANSYTSSSNGGQKSVYYNVTFGKLTDYDCGRIMLSARYGCPPCDRPDATGSKYVSITVESGHTVNADGAIELCKESDGVELNIEPLKLNGVAAGTAFDILWFDDREKLGKEADAIVVKNGEKQEMTTDWATVMDGETETDVEKWYYVMVRDNAKPTSADCFVYDSIKVIAHPAPLDTLANIEFCVGTLEDEPDLTIVGKTINWDGGVAPTGIKDMTASASFVYTVTDDETGCEGEEHTLVITVNSTDEPDVNQTVGILKKPNTNYSLSSAVNTAAVAPEIIRWYDDAMTLLNQSDAKVSQTEAGEYVFFATMYNTATGCESDTVRVTVTVNDAPTPTPHNEHLCVGDNITDMSVYADLESSEYEFRWYTDPDAAKGTGSTTAPTFEATTAGVYEFYVSQINMTTNAESEKSTIKITVHEVATLDLSGNKTEYCVSSTETADALVFASNNDGDLTESDLVWSVSPTMSPSSATMTPDITVARVTPYYIQPVYVNANSYAGASNASAVCRGTVQNVDITVNSTDKPVTSGLISYVKTQGEENGFARPLAQDPSAIDVTGKESGYTLMWYDEDGNVVADPTPKYEDVKDLTGNKEYNYNISWVNNTTHCESEKVPIKIVVSGFPAPMVKPLEFCELAESETIDLELTAKINAPNPYSESDFELIWFRPAADGSIDETTEYMTAPNLNEFSLAVDGNNEREHDYFFGVIQQYRGDVNKRGPMAKLRVTMYARPKIKPNDPDPICKGESVDLKNHYDYSNRLILANVNVEARFQGGEAENTSIVKEAGTYSCQCYFELAKADGTTQTCYSDWDNIKVTVDTLSAKIKGSTTTCPNVPVLLESDVKSNVDKTSRPWTYKWESSNGVSETTENNTISAGLETSGKKVTTKLTVEAGKCKVTTDAWTITVGDGPVVGDIVFTESDNNKSGDVYTLNETGPVFASCGGSVSVGLKKVNCTADGFSYSGPESGSGTFTTSPNATSTEAGALLGEATFKVSKPGIYTVTYTNKCDAKFRFEIVNASVTAKETRNAIEMCEGEPFTSVVTVTPATPTISYVIKWEKDGTTIANTGDVLAIAQTRVTDSGKYTYTVSSEGCVFEGKVAQGVPLLVKPNITFNSSMVSNYEAIREKSVTMEALFDVPDNASDVSAISSDILWTEDGETANAGAQHAIASADKDHEYTVKVYPEGYCGASTKVTLKVDALLQLTAQMPDVENEQMCLNEEHTLSLDTTGTGKVLHASELMLKVEEVIDGSATDITSKFAKSNGLLVAKISPKKDAKYNITYTYARGNQDKSTSLNITVHQPFDIEWAYEPNDAEVCEGDAVSVTITKMEPNDGLTTLTWDMTNEDITFADAANGNATITPILTTNDLKQTKKYTLTATNGICMPKEYHPQVTVDRPIEGEIRGPERVCEGKEAVLDASSFQAETYTWTCDQFEANQTMSGAVISVRPKPESAVYGLIMTRGKCTRDEDEWPLLVTFAPDVDTVLDHRNSQVAAEYGYRAVRIDLAGGTGSAPFVYKLGGEVDSTESYSVVFSEVGYGSHSVTVTDEAGCETTYSFNVPQPSIEFPNVMSPNGDGRGDRFEPAGLKEKYPNADVHIYDRWGKEVANYKGSADGWDGTYNGKPVPSTDYWYEILIEEIETTYVGHFTLLRQ